MPTNEANGKDTSLKWEVFITPGIPVVTSTPAPNTKETFWNPTSSILIYGKRDAILVDVPTTWQEAVTLTRWVRDSRQEPHNNLYHSWTRRPLVRRFSVSRSLS